MDFITANNVVLESLGKVVSNNHSSKSLLDDTKFVINYILNNIDVDMVEDSVLLKLRCLKTIVYVRLKSDNNISPDIIITKLSTSADFSRISDYIEKLKDFVSVPLSSIINDVNRVRELYKDFKIIEATHSLASLYDKIILDMQNSSSSEKADFIKSEINKLILLLSSLDNNNKQNIILSPNNIKSVISYMVDNFKESKLTYPTLFPTINNILRGGYKSGRVYIWAAPSGQGKSTVLVNSMVGLFTSLEDNPNQIEQLENFHNNFRRFYPDKIPTVFYFTNENTVSETWIRLASILLSRNIESIEDFKNDENLVAQIESIFSETNINIVIEYIEPHKVSVNDISLSLKTYESLHYMRPILVIVDYLDRLQTLDKIDNERLRLGRVVDDLKALSIEFETPVVTATQLNRESLRTNDETGSISNISESWKKIENADVVFTFKTKFEPNTNSYVSSVKIGKHRYNKNYNPDTVIKLVQNANDSYRLKEIFSSESSQNDIDNINYNVGLDSSLSEFINW